MHQFAHSRRWFLRQCLCSGASLTGVAMIAAACNNAAPGKKKEQVSADGTCCDYSALTGADKKARESLGFVTASPIASKTCSGCKLWLPGTCCGRCQLFKGPVPASGYCTYWAPQS